MKYSFCQKLTILEHSSKIERACFSNFWSNVKIQFLVRLDDMTRVILPLRLFDQMERFWSLSKFWKKLLYLNKSLDYLFKIESGVTIILIKISLVQLLFLVVHLGLVPSSTPFSFKINGSYVISSIVLFYFKGELEF